MATRIILGDNRETLLTFPGHADAIGGLRDQPVYVFNQTDTTDAGKYTASFTQDATADRIDIRLKRNNASGTYPLVEKLVFSRNSNGSAPFATYDCHLCKAMYPNEGDELVGDPLKPVFTTHGKPNEYQELFKMPVLNGADLATVKASAYARHGMKVIDCKSITAFQSDNGGERNLYVEIFFDGYPGMKFRQITPATPDDCKRSTGVITTRAAAALTLGLVVLMDSGTYQAQCTFIAIDFVQP